MDIGIIGGGSIGLLYGAYLAETNDLTIYTRTSRQANMLQKNGIILERDCSSKVVNVKASVFDQTKGKHDLLIIAVKQYHLKDVFNKLKDYDSNSSILFLQNGMSHITLLSSLTFNNVLIGIVEHGAMKIGDTRVIHTGIGTTKISTFAGKGDDVFSLFDKVTSHVFSYSVKKDIEDNLKEKLIINSCINPLTSLYRVENGELISNDFFFQSMKSLFYEVISVIPINDEKRLWNQIINVCTNTANNRSSMLKDVEEGRLTEIDSILGYVLNQAKTKGQTLKICSFVYKAIKGIENRG